MFEKEAEEYYYKTYPVTLNLREEERKKEVTDVFIKGAEFGYNKSEAETALLSQHILDLQKDKGNLTDRVRELEQQIEKMKSQYDYAFNQLCESREIICLMLSQHKNKKEIDYSTRERGEKLLKQGVYKND